MGKKSADYHLTNRDWLPSDHYERESLLFRGDPKAWAAMTFIRRWWGEPIARQVWDALTPQQKKRVRPLLPPK